MSTEPIPTYLLSILRGKCYQVYIKRHYNDEPRSSRKDKRQGRSTLWRRACYTDTKFGMVEGTHDQFLRTFSRLRAIPLHLNWISRLRAQGAELAS